MPHFFRSALVATLLIVSPAISAADEITDAIRQATDHYSANNLSAARVSLGEATHFLDQKILENLAKALPSKIDGWTFNKEGDSSSAGGLLGAGNQVSRYFVNSSNDQETISLQITSDSPVVAQMAIIYTNPQMAGAMGKLISVGKQRALVENSGNIIMIYNNRFLIQASGGASTEDKTKAIQAIDFSALEKL